MSTIKNEIQSVANPWRVVWMESKFELIKTLRMPGFVFPAIAFPLMFYIFFGLIFSGGSAGGQVPVYLLATYGTFGVIGPALFGFGAGVATERGEGWLDVKQVSPMPPLAYILAKIFMAACFALILVVSLFALAALFGDVRLYQSQWILLALTLMLGIIPFCALGLILGLLCKSQSAPGVVNLLYLPMSFLSGLWVPINFFPDILQHFALALPPYHLAQLALKVLNQDMGQSLWLHVGALLTFTFVAVFLAVKAYNKQSS